MTTAQDVVRSVLTRAGLAYLDPSIAGGDPQVAEIVDLLNECGQDLALRGEWQAMLKSAALGTLPTDFSKLAFVVTITGVHARHVTDPSLWAFLVQNPTTQPHYRIAGGSVMIAPDQDAGMHYWSSSWTEAGDSVSADGDVIFLPESIMVSGTFYRWLRKKGFPFDDQMAQHEAEVEAAQQVDR